MKSQETRRNEINTACRSHTITDGCDGGAVSTVGCGPASPGSIPGHGPFFFQSRISIVLRNMKSSLQNAFFSHVERRNFITAPESLRYGWDAYGGA